MMRGERDVEDVEMEGKRRGREGGALAMASYSLTLTHA